MLRIRHKKTLDQDKVKGIDTHILCLRLSPRSQIGLKLQAGLLAYLQLSERSLPAMCVVISANA